MSNRSKWAMAWVWLLVCAFAFGYGYGVAYEEALADNKCNCTKYCPTTGDYEPAKQWPPEYICDFDPINCFDCVLPK